MPSKSPPIGPKLSNYLRKLGQEIQDRRKFLKISAVATSEAAGISRMTLNRIERGELSVTMSSYLSVAEVLGLEFKLAEKNRQKTKEKLNLSLGSKIILSDYPQLKKLAWQVNKTQKVSLKEALNLYERNWRHIDQKNISKKEQEFIKSLLEFFGKEKLLV